VFEITEREGKDAILVRKVILETHRHTKNQKNRKLRQFQKEIALEPAENRGDEN
jgi:hypothetical protein